MNYLYYFNQIYFLDENVVGKKVGNDVVIILKCAIMSALL